MILANEDSSDAAGIFQVSTGVDLRILLEDVAEQDECAIDGVGDEHVDRLRFALDVAARHEECDEVPFEPREMPHVSRTGREFLPIEKFAQRRVQLIGRCGDVGEGGIVPLLPVLVGVRHAGHGSESATEGVDQRIG